MYCPPEFPYQIPTDYTHFETSATYPTPQLQAYNTNISPYASSTSQDRPSPSFRIEDILLQNKGVHSALPYGSPYQPPYYGNYQNSHLPHSCGNDREIQGVPNSSINPVPVYFRLRPNLRTPNGRKCRKPRTVFSELQLMVLEREFNEHKYLSTPQRTKLADRLGLNQTQVKTWYQNRRMKWKKESSDPKTSSVSEDDCSAMTHSLVEQIQQSRETVDNNI